MNKLITKVRVKMNRNHSYEVDGLGITTPNPRESCEKIVKKYWPAIKVQSMSFVLVGTVGIFTNKLADQPDRSKNVSS